MGNNTACTLELNNLKDVSRRSTFIINHGIKVNNFDFAHKIKSWYLYK